MNLRAGDQLVSMDVIPAELADQVASSAGDDGSDDVDEGDEVAIALRARGAQELAAVVHALDPEKTCEAMVYGSLFHNAVYHACVEQYADRPLTRIDDVLAAVAASLHG